jgi:hypothetical protein
MTEAEALQMQLSLLTRVANGIDKLVAIAEKRKVGDNVGPAIADDKDLDSKFGDEQVKFDPRDWTGNSCKGAPMSHCPPEYLDALAAAFDYFAGRNAGDPKKAGYDRRSAARARGWAKRLRAGWKPAQPSMSEDFGADDFGADDRF